MSPHRALDTLDILYRIFEQLPPEREFPKRLEGLLNLNLQGPFVQNRRALACAARVCKAFTTPALTVLWRSLDDFIPLFSLFSLFKAVPFEKTERRPTMNTFVYDLGRMPSEKTWMLCGRLSDDDWERFRIYAAFVRTACYFKLDEIDPSVFVHLSHRNHGRPLLPSLQKLTMEQSPAFEAGLLSLLSPSLRFLNLFVGIGSAIWPKGQFTRRDFALEAILERVCSTAPSLIQFNISGWIRPASIVPITNLKCLRVVHLSFVNRLADPCGDLLRTLSASDTLVELHVPHDLLMDSTSSGVGFPALQVLSIHGGLSNVASLFRAISSPCLQEVSLTAATADAIDDLPIALSGCSKFASSIQTITICIQARLRRTEPIEEEVRSVISCLEPTLQLRRMKVLWFQFHRTLTISDNDLSTFGKAWPLLTDFCVSHQTTAVAPTMRGIQALARSCRDLKTLNLPCLDPTPPYVDESPFVDHELKMLCIEKLSPQVPSTETVELASAVGRLFPQIDVRRSKAYRMDLREVKKSDHPWSVILESLPGNRSTGTSSETVDAGLPADGGYSQ